jgi:hypothetical protein
VISLTITFVGQMVVLCADLLGLILALAAAPLLRSRLAALLVVLNLTLLLELLAVLNEPGYHYGEMLVARTLAATAHVLVAWWCLNLWRRWAVQNERVTAH